MGIGPQYVTRTYTDSDGNSFEMLEAQYTSKGRFTGRRWYVCQICGLDYPEDKVVLQGDTAFCTPLRHNEEINERRQGGDV